MKITFESYWKRAAALNTKEPEPPKKFIKSHQKAQPTQTKGTLLPSKNKIERYKINPTNALPKVRYPAAPAKNWQSYNDTRVGVRWSRRSMVKHVLIGIIKLKYIREYIKHVDE